MFHRSQGVDDHKMSTLPLHTVAWEVEDYNAVPRKILAQQKDDNLQWSSMSWLPRYSLKAYDTIMRLFVWLVAVAIILSLTYRIHAYILPARSLDFWHGAANTSQAMPSRQATLEQKMGALCEDVDAAQCEQLTAVDSTGKLPKSCLPNSTGLAASRCPRSCGLCAIVLGDCSKAEIRKESSCIEGEDVVGEVCDKDGNWKEEAYCTWLSQKHGPKPRQFVCAHCADQKLSAERRALVAQMLELRFEEDGREVDQIRSRHGDSIDAHRESIAERNAIVTPR